jgi:hypothetical protein
LQCRHLGVVFELIGGQENNPPTPHMHAPRTEANPAPCPPEEDAGRRRRKKSFE